MKKKGMGTTARKREGNMEDKWSTICIGANGKDDFMRPVSAK
jgi:hypothetical protein